MKLYLKYHKEQLKFIQFQTYAIILTCGGLPKPHIGLSTGLHIGLSTGLAGN